MNSQMNGILLIGIIGLSVGGIGTVGMEQGILIVQTSANTWNIFTFGYLTDTTLWATMNCEEKREHVSDIHHAPIHNFNYKECMENEIAR
jgi:hypothetical protein